MPTILDQHGNPIDLGTLREPQTAHVAHLAREFEQHPSRGLTPARLDAILRQTETGDLLRLLDLADDMEERDAHLYAELHKRKGAITVLEWDLQEPDGASRAERKLTAQLGEWLHALPDFEDLLLGLMDGVLKGFAMHEMVWQLDGGVLLPQVTFRPQRWFTLDEATRNVLMLRSATARGEPLQPFSWITHQHRSRNGYMARQSLARVLAWPYLFKNYSVRDLAEFLEIYGLPLRVGKYPSGAGDAEKRALLRAVTEIGHNAAGIIPQGMAVEFQAAAAGNEVPFMAMVSMMEASESKAILGQTLTASEGQHGTQALGKVHDGVRMDIRNADARQVESTLNRQLLYPVAVLNIPGVDPRRLPKFVFDTGEAEDMAAYADSLPKLAAAGLRIPVKWAQDKLRIPEPAEGEAVLAAPPPPALPPGGDPAPQDKPPKPGKAPLKGASQDGSTAPRDALDDVLDEAIAEWRPMLAPLVEPLLAELDQAVAAGESLADFAARLPELIQSMDGRPLAERLARAAFVARLAGEADLDLEDDEQPHEQGT
jgi:phage gp29-like protein